MTESASSVPADTSPACFAPCPRGLESALATELEGLGAAQVAPVNGGVGFHADWALIGKLNLHTRLASRILVQLESRRYRTDKDLYKIAYGVAWEDWFGSEQTLRVDTNAIRSTINNLNIATLRVKDAIVDRLRERTGERPNIDTREPNVRVFVFLTDRQATLYLDTSGENLFKRGWRGRHDKGAAPLKENLAAGLLALSGWTPGIPLYDPFCGSGTIIIEAAQQVLGIPAGNLRSFGLEHLSASPDAIWANAGTNVAHDGGTDDEARQGETADNPDATLYASDIDPAMSAMTRTNAERAGVSQAIHSIHTGDFLDMPAPCATPGMIVTNPPYGERMDFAGAQDSPLNGADGLLAMGAHMRKAYPGWKICMLSADLKLPGKLGLKASRRIELFNGPIEARLFVFEMRPAR